MKKRLLALLTVLCMLLSMLPATAFAKTVEPLEPVYISQYNPLYGEPDEGITLEQYAPVTLADHAFEGQNYPDDREQVVATLRAGLEARQNTITFNYFLDGDTYDGSEGAGKAMLSGLFASALEHTGEPTEGDYIHWVYEKMSAGSNGYVYGGDYYLTITFTMTYYTTAAQEQAVTDRLATVMPSFGFTAETDDYTKVKTIYDYICDNVTYDNTNLKDDAYTLKYTAYAALINGTSVCQGYAVLLYRMLLMAGVDNRVITGISNGGNHAWNIIKLGEYYYDADSTWDAGETEYDYFLRCPANFDPTHTRHDEYDTAAFNTAYPMADADYYPHAADTLPEGLTYTVSGDNVTITGYTGTLTELTIPSTIEGKTVTAIGASAFTFCSSLVKVTLPNSVTKIGSSAFNTCSNLTSVNIPTGVTVIEPFTFQQCSSLTDIDLHENITAVGKYAFANCSALKTIAIPAGVTALEERTFYQCVNLTTVSLPQQLLAIGAHAFSQCTSLKSISIPDTVTAIGDSAFYFCSALKALDLPANLISIGASAFNSCEKLTSVTVPNKVTGIGNEAFQNCDDLTRITFTGDLPTIGSSCFPSSYGYAATAYYPCDNDTWTDTAVANLTATYSKVTWTAAHDPKTVSGTPSSCFTGGLSDGVQCEKCSTWLTPQTPVPAGHKFESGYCTVCALPEGLTYTVYGNQVSVTGYTGILTELTIPATIEGKAVTVISFGAFEECSDLESVTLPGSVTTIGGFAFDSCTSLKSINFPSSVKTIGPSAFRNCTALESVVLLGDVTAIDSSAFSGCTSLKSINLPASITSLGGSAFYGCTSLKSITVPASITTLGDYLFYNCTALESVTLQGKVTSIGIAAFAGCDALKSIDLPDSVVAIGTNAFSSCYVLADITIPNKVTKIGENTFSFCKALTDITIPNSVKTVAKNAFIGCSSLKSVTFGSGVTEIANYAFDTCSSLSSITFTGDLPTIGARAFSGTTATALYPCNNDTWTDTAVADLAAAHTSVTWTADHDPKTVSGTANSCFTGGISDGVQCTICEEWLTPQTPVPAGHKFESGYCTICGLPQGLQYRLTVIGEEVCNDKLTIIGYTGTLTELTVPETINGKTVTAIGDGTFMSHTTLKKVTLPDTITEIGYNGFAYCRPLESINIPSGVTTIKGHAFEGCNQLTEITLPAGLISVETYAFADCAGLTEVTIPNKVTSIGSKAFAYCDNLRSITFTGDLPAVDAYAFHETTATTLYPCNNDTWTDTAVADLAAAHTSVTWTAAHDPKTVSGTPNSCFTGGISDGVQCTICEEWLTPQTPVPAGHKNENGYCTVCGLPEGLTYTVYGDTVTVTGYTGTLTELTIPATIEGKTVTALDGGGAFQHNTTLKKVTLPDTLTAFGGYTFNGCSALESVNIPAGVKSIGGYSFANCTALKSITIPEGVTEIGVHAFYQSGLTSVTVPNSVTSVLGGAFSYCKSLTDVTLGSGLTVLPTSLFSGCSALKTLTIPANVTTIGDYAFQHCTALERITIPSKVTDIGQYAFYNCDALEEITFTGDLPIFGTACFDAATATALYPCDNDTWTDTLVANLASAYPSVTWTAAHDPKTVSGTPNSCFSGGISDGVQCTICEEWLTPQTPVPAGHKLIVDGYCTVCGLPQGLTYTVNGDTVTVTDYTGSLTELTIPETINGKTVTAIDDYAFDGCVRLTRITLPDSVTTIGKFAFMSCSALENVNIPASVNAIRNGTFSGCASLKTVSLPSHIGSIGDYAFDGCTGLERITLPNSVTSIGMYAFESCTALERITIPASVTDIGKHAFVYCSHLAEVRFLGNAPIFGPNCFSGVTADAYYPCGDTWTENKLQSYGGSISWTVEHNYVGGICTGCGAAEPSVDGVYRLAGSNRFDTAFKSADALKEVMGVDKFPAAIVTSGMNFADALAGSYLAARTGAPILLTDNDNMADVIAYILENVEEGGVVYALGGSSIVSDTLRAVTNSGYTFKRLAGASRFETNLMILEEAGIDSGDPVLVCTAYNFADSLSASALGLPILLVDDTVSAAQMAFLEENADGEFILVGGTGAVKPAVEQQLREKWDVVRLAGASRFDTSVLTAIESFGSSGVDYAVLAYGYNFPDGLCAGPLAYALGAPLILTANGDESAAVEYATAAGITDGFVLGGPSLIDDTVTRAIFSMTAGDIIQR